jgi:hypothetical protein
MIRKLDTSSFGGDSWADDATLTVPDADVVRLIATASVVRWTVVGMNGKGETAEQVPDTTTSISTCLVKLSRTPGRKTLVRPLVATSGAIIGHEVTETDVSPGDVFVIAVPAFAVGSAPWLWVIPTAGCSTLPSGASP